MDAWTAPLDPIALTQALIRCPSVTPEEGGALRLIEAILAANGFTCLRVDRNGTPNLFARWGPKGALRTFAFNGHTDVVPPGDLASWRFPPFSGTLAEGRIWGRGAADMKSAVAAFVAAATAFVAEAPPEDGAVMLLLTGDEEGPATDGTKALLEWMATARERMDHCIVGEPTCQSRMGEAIKIGRRGSLSVRIVATGKQGHSAYPERAHNPLPVLVALLHRLATASLDKGFGPFPPSTLTLTTIDTGNPASNVIPERAEAQVNIRFNPAQSAESLTDWIRAEAAAISAGSGVSLSLAVAPAAEPFLTEPGEFTTFVAETVAEVTGVWPEFSTSGGTSDARFIRAECPVVECGLVGPSLHQVDEHVAVEDVRLLTKLYRRLLERYFSGAPLGTRGR